MNLCAQDGNIMSQDADLDYKGIFWGSVGIFENKNTWSEAFLKKHFITLKEVFWVNV